jgi:hypothetical protein
MRGRVAALLIVATAVWVGAVATQPASAAVSYFWGAIARHSGKCLEIPATTSSVWPSAIQYNCHGGPNQQWRRVRQPSGYLQISSRVDKQCLTVVGASMTDGANVIVSPCRTGANQEWQATYLGNGYYRYVARHSGKCLTVATGSTANWANVVQYTCTGSSNQQWIGVLFEPAV